jgi:hypothetical protein
MFDIGGVQQPAGRLSLQRRKPPQAAPIMLQ